jgi:eukaryotic-like serine/threonine-protein kinase
VPVSSRSLPAKVSSGPVSIDSQPLSVPFAQGDIIAGKYEVVGLLGSGGVAYVISALHLELGEMVALKFLRPESLAFEDVVARFASEARAVARIKSEHVAHVFDVGTLPDGAPFIVMEHLEGRDLADVLAEKRRVPVKVAVDYVLQACEALACAHALGIVHRDIKPENLFLSQQAGSVEVVKVLDFGISKNALGTPRVGGRESAKTMLPMGTPGYMSPEQIRACGAVDARTDIWALGCVLSELITGTSAFEAPTQIQLGAAILERDPVPLRQKIAEASPQLESVVLRCLAKDPAERFQDVAELATALYPFGPRRGRLSAERCHEVLRGKSGVIIELNSVPPPSSLSDDEVTSLRNPQVSAIPSAMPKLEPLRTSAPATLTSMEDPTRFRAKGRGVAIAAVLAVAAAVGITLGMRAPTVDSPVPPAAAGEQRTAPALSPVAVTPTPVVRPGGPAEEPVMLAKPAASVSSGAAREVDAPRTKSTRVQRAAAAAAAAAAKREALAKAKPAAPKRAVTVDDGDPDVGY